LAVNLFDKAEQKNYNFQMIHNMNGFIEEGSEEEDLVKKLDKKKIPVHIALIMDGNGRWAMQNGLDRVEGHKEGIRSARVVTECAARLGIKYLTLFTFSSENWKRPVKEVNILMDMLYKSLVEEKNLLVKNKIKLNILGDTNRLPEHLKAKLRETQELSKNFKNMQVNLALSYGSRMEIIGAVKRIVDDGIQSSRVNEKLFRKYLYTMKNPDPDLLIRTSGEFRISNFLLFQIAYSELYFTKTLWPDFKAKAFLNAILEFQKRDRRFGGI
jgi:undecaprenyl diphosphate synthase